MPLARRLFPFLLVASPLLLACGGRSSDLLPTADAGPDSSSETPPAIDSGAGSVDAGDSAAPPNDDASIPGCPGVPPIPTAPVYDCEPTATPATGCPPWDATEDAGVWYPLGCNVRLPSPQAACIGACCGAQTCGCEPGIPNGGSASFLCAL